MMQDTGRATLFVGLFYIFVIRQVSSFCKKHVQPVTQTYSNVHDNMGNALCTIVSTPVIGPTGGLLVDCMRYCTSVPGWTCYGYTYYQGLEDLSSV